MISIHGIRNWLAEKLEVPGYQQLRRDAIIDKMGVTFTVALTGKEKVNKYQSFDTKWPQVQITPFLWEEDHRLFILPHDRPYNLIPGDQVTFTYHSRDHSGGCCPATTEKEWGKQPSATGTNMINPGPMLVIHDFPCILCFKPIPADENMVTIEPNHYHESCYLADRNPGGEQLIPEGTTCVSCWIYITSEDKYIKEDNDYYHKSCLGIW